MKELLRAEWLRFRRRIDLWVICIGVLVVGAIGFLNGYKQEATDPPRMSAAEIRQMVSDPNYYGGDPEFAPPPSEVDEIVAQQLAADDAAQAEWDASQLLTLQKYDLVQAPITMIGLGIVPLIAVLIMATLVVGDEFRFGTIRTSLIAASDRRRFLAARLLTIAAIAIGLFLGLALLAVALAIGLHLVGAELPPPTTGIDPFAALATVLAELLSGFAIVALAVALCVVVRSGAIPVLLVLIGLAADVFVTSLPVFVPGEALAVLRELSLTTSIRTLVASVASSTGAGTFELEAVPSAIDIPSWGTALIVAAWLALFLVLADRRFGRMDIVE